jgi:hypothetical protein
MTAALCALAYKRIRIDRSHSLQFVAELRTERLLSLVQSKRSSVLTPTLSPDKSSCSIETKGGSRSMHRSLRATPQV